MSHFKAFSIFLFFCFFVRSIVIFADQTTEIRVLKKDSIVFSITKKRKLYRNPENKIVKIAYANKSKTKAFILDKNGRPLLMTATTNLESLGGVHKLQPQINPLQIHQKYGLELKPMTYDKDRVSLHTSFNFARGSSRFYENLFETEDQATSSFSFNNSFYYIKNELPVHLGVDLSYQYKHVAGQREKKANIDTLFLGPSFMTAYAGFIFELGFTQSLLSRSTISGSVFEFSSTGYKVKAQREFSLGQDTKFLLGVQYLTLRHELKNNHSLFPSLPADLKEDSWGLMIGYPFSWHL